MSSYSGLSASKAAIARRIFAEGAAVCMTNKDRLHYNREGNRWQGINSRIVAVSFSRNRASSGGISVFRTGKTLTYGDCSSTGIWLLWQSLYRPFRVGDIVNGAGWKAGYTGTLLRHGRSVSDIDDLKVGDAVIYGSGDGDHVAWAVGGGRLFSHGSDPGPFIVSTSYRAGDIQAIRRYI